MEAVWSAHRDHPQKEERAGYRHFLRKSSRCACGRSFGPRRAIPPLLRMDGEGCRRRVDKRPYRDVDGRHGPGGNGRHRTIEHIVQLGLRGRRRLDRLPDVRKGSHSPGGGLRFRPSPRPAAGERLAGDLPPRGPPPRPESRIGIHRDGEPRSEQVREGASHRHAHGSVPGGPDNPAPVRGYEAQGGRHEPDPGGSLLPPGRGVHGVTPSIAAGYRSG